MPSLNSDNNVNIVIGTEADDSGIKKITDSMGGMVDNFQGGMKKLSIATAVVGAGLTAFAKSSTDYLTDLVKSSKGLAKQTGMTIEQSSSLIAVLQRLGISADAASGTFKIFAKQISKSREDAKDNVLVHEQLTNKIAATKIAIGQLTEQVNKNGDSSGALHNKIESLNLQLQTYAKQLNDTSNPLDKLNVATKNADGSNRGFNDILLSVADRFKELPDGAEKTALALQLFGRSGDQMIKILDKGSKGIIELEDQAKKLGLTLTSQNIGAINNYIESQKRLADSSNSIKIAVGSLTAPVLSKFNEKLNEVIQKLVGVDSPMRNATAAVLAFGGPIAGASGGVLAFIGSLDQAVPLLKSFGLFLANPMFLAFAVTVGIIGVAVYDLQKKMGGWSNMMKEATKELRKIGDRIADYLEPKLKDLGKSLEKLWIPLKKFVEEYILPLVKILGPAIGVGLVWAIGTVVDALDILLKILTPVFQFLDTHKGVVQTLAAVFGTLAAAMAFNAVINAMIIGFNTLMLVTIPSMVATIGGLTAAFQGFVTLAMGPIVVPALIVVAAVASINSIKQAWNDVYNAKEAADSLTSDATIIRLQKQAKEARARGDTAAVNRLSNAIAAQGGNKSNRASGGPVTAGKPYLVGENSDGSMNSTSELFVPNQSGSIVSAKDTQKLLGSGRSINITQNIYNQVDYNRGLAEIGFRLSNA